MMSPHARPSLPNLAGPEDDHAHAVCRAAESPYRRAASLTASWMVPSPASPPPSALSCSARTSVSREDCFLCYASVADQCTRSASLFDPTSGPMRKAKKSHSSRINKRRSSLFLDADSDFRAFLPFDAVDCMEISMPAQKEVTITASKSHCSSSLAAAASLSESFSPILTCSSHKKKRYESESCEFECKVAKKNADLVNFLGSSARPAADSVNGLLTCRRWGQDAAEARSLYARARPLKAIAVASSTRDDGGVFCSNSKQTKAIVLAATGKTSKDSRNTSTCDAGAARKLSSVFEIPAPNFRIAATIVTGLDESWAALDAVCRQVEFSGAACLLITRRLLPGDCWKHATLSLRVNRDLTVTLVRSWPHELSATAATSPPLLSSSSGPPSTLSLAKRLFSLPIAPHSNRSNSKMPPSSDVMFLADISTVTYVSKNGKPCLRVHGRVHCATRPESWHLYPKEPADTLVWADRLRAAVALLRLPPFDESAVETRAQSTSMASISCPLPPPLQSPIICSHYYHCFGNLHGSAAFCRSYGHTMPATGMNEHWRQQHQLQTTATRLLCAASREQGNYQVKCFGDRGDTNMGISEQSLGADSRALPKSPQSTFKTRHSRAVLSHRESNSLSVFLNSLLTELDAFLVVGAQTTQPPQRQRTQSYYRTQNNLEYKIDEENENQKDNEEKKDVESDEENDILDKYYGARTRKNSFVYSQQLFLQPPTSVPAQSRQNQLDSEGSVYGDLRSVDKKGTRVTPSISHHFEGFNCSGGAMTSVHDSNNQAQNLQQSTLNDKPVEHHQEPEGTLSRVRRWISLLRKTQPDSRPSSNAAVSATGSTPIPDTASPACEVLVGALLKMHIHGNGAGDREEGSNQAPCEEKRSVPRRQPSLVRRIFCAEGRASRNSRR